MLKKDLYYKKILCYKNHTRTPVTQTSCNVEILALWAPYKSVQRYKPPKAGIFHNNSHPL